MGLGRWFFVLCLLVGGCMAQSAATTLRASPPRSIPATPSWNWIVHYAAGRLRDDLPQWARQLQAIAADGNNLTPAQQGNLQNVIAPVAVSLEKARPALAEPFSTAACPKPLGNQIWALSRQFEELERDVGPPWTRHDHRNEIQNIFNSLLGFDFELGCSPNLEPSFPTTAGAPAKPYTGALHGHVLAASGTTLPGAHVYLKGVGLGLSILGTAQDAEFRANGAVGEDVVTASSGAWKFAGLPPGCYLLTAADAGHLPVFDEITIASGAPRNCARARTEAFYANHVASAPATGDISLLLAPSGVSAMAYGPLVAAYPFRQGELRFDEARFSPDETTLDFRLDSGAVPDRWSNWNYDLGAGKLIRLGNTTPSQPDDEQPGHPVAPPERLEMVPPIDEPETAKLSLAPDAIWAQNLGHGDVHLFVERGNGNPRSIAEGSWGLDSTIVDRASRLAYFPEFDHAAVSIYDFRTGKIRQLDLPTRAERLLAAAPIQGGLLIAYIANGSCDHVEETFPRMMISRICFLRLPNAKSN